MSNQKAIIQLIKEISGHENIVAVPKLFIKATGSLDAAFFLSQLIYWSDKGKGEKGWFYKTYQDWQDELGLSPYQVRQITAKFQINKLVQTKIKKANGSPTVHYRVNMENVSKWIVKFFNNPTLKNLTNLNRDYDRDYKEKPKTKRLNKYGLKRKIVDGLNSTQTEATADIAAIMVQNGF